MVRIKVLKIIICTSLVLFFVYLYLLGVSILCYYATLPYRIFDPWIEYDKLIMSAFMMVYAVLIILLSIMLLSIVLAISFG